MLIDRNCINIEAVIETFYIDNQIVMFSVPTVSGNIMTAISDAGDTYRYILPAAFNLSKITLEAYLQCIGGKIQRGNGGFLSCTSFSTPSNNGIYPDTAYGIIPSFVSANMLQDYSGI